MTPKFIYLTLISKAYEGRNMIHDTPSYDNTATHQIS